MNVNREQRRTFAEFYTNAIQDGNIVFNLMTAGMMFMVGNATFEHSMFRELSHALSILHECAWPYHISRSSSYQQQIGGTSLCRAVRSSDLCLLTYLSSV